MPLGFLILVAIFFIAEFGCFESFRLNEYSISVSVPEEEFQENDENEGEIEFKSIDDSSTQNELLSLLQVPEIRESFEALAALDFASLQEAVDVWAANYGSNAVAVEVYNVSTSMVVASHRANVQMRPRSIYKLFYLYDAYAQIDAGLDSFEQELIPGYSLGTCLDLMIRYSNNPCAEAMLDDSARLARVGQLIQRLGLFSTWPDGLRTSAHDVSVLLQYYYRHPEWSESSWQKFRDSALNQSYTYRKGLPSGFSMARVYNKVGWGGSNYNDAAMVEFGNGQRYIVVVMTDGVGYTALTELGRMLEKTMLK